MALKCFLPARFVIHESNLSLLDTTNQYLVIHNGWSNDPIPQSRETRRTGGNDCNHYVPAGFAVPRQVPGHEPVETAAHG